jgi:HAMP domain-containing protein
VTATIATATRSYSTRELQAAAAALAAGRFSATTPIAEAPGDRADRTNAAAQSTGKMRVQPSSRAWTSAVHSAVDGPMPVSGMAPLARVRAANGGAGASTIALALADAADALSVRVRVLDAAAPAWSGLLGATVTELAAVGGWRRGRRGANVLIDRVEDPVQIPAEVPTPRAAEGVDLTLLDAGWSMRELTAASVAGAWLATAPARVEVLVTRPQALALSQTEAALADLEEQLAADQVVVVVVGASRWSAREFAAAGRLLREAHQQDAVLFTPLLSAKTLPGLGPDPLPKQLAIPSRRLLERITTITGPLTANRT